MDEHRSDYEEGLREGRLKSLEKCVQELHIEVSRIKIAVWMVYGAIGLVSFLPDLKKVIAGD